MSVFCILIMGNDEETERRKDLNVFDSTSRYEEEKHVCLIFKQLTHVDILISLIFPFLSLNVA